MILAVSTDATGGPFTGTMRVSRSAIVAKYAGSPAITAYSISFTGKPASLMIGVADRPGHDRRYALSSEKLQRDTGWQAEMPFEQGLAATIRWYRENPAWIANVKSGEYQHYYQRNYANR